MNKPVKPNAGDVYCERHYNRYRMYVEVPGRQDLLCINLDTGAAYVHNQDNGLVDPNVETFVFNMCDVVTSNKQDDLWTK